MYGESIVPIHAIGLMSLAIGILMQWANNYKAGYIASVPASKGHVPRAPAEGGGTKRKCGNFFATRNKQIFRELC